MQSNNWLKDNGIDFELTIVTCFVCLEFIVQFENCSLIPGPLPVKTYARHSWSLSKKGVFLTCHTYCDTGLLFIMVISEDP